MCRAEAAERGRGRGRARAALWQPAPAEAVGGGFCRLLQVLAALVGGDCRGCPQKQRCKETLVTFSEIRVSSAGYTQPDGLALEEPKLKPALHFSVTSELLLSEGALAPKRALRSLSRSGTSHFVFGFTVLRRKS